jgi:CHAT domain-containing protein/uncharacterized protein HemY
MIRLIIQVFFILSFSSSFFAQKESYFSLMNKYENYTKYTNLEGRLRIAKKMNLWSFLNEGDTSLRYAITFRYIGDCFENLQNIDSAMFYYNKSLTTLTLQNRSKSRSSSECFLRITELYFDNEDYTNAIFNYEKYIEIIKKQNGIKKLDYITAIDYLGYLHLLNGEYELSEFYLIKAKKYFRLRLKNQPGYASCLKHLGDLYYEIAQYKTAELYYLKALAIYTGSKEIEDYNISICCQGLGLLYIALGDYKNAEHYLTKSLQVIEKIYGVNDLNFGSILSNLASLYFLMEEYNTSIIYFTRSLEIKKSEKFINRVSYFDELIGLGLNYYIIGDYKLAESSYNEALEIYKNSSSRTNTDVGMLLINLGSNYAKIGNYNSAEACYLEALLMYEQNKGNTNNDRALILNNLGGLDLLRGNLISTESRLQEALEIYRNSVGIYHPDYAMTLDNLARYYSELGNYDLAEQYIKQSIEIYKKCFGMEDSKYANSLMVLGIIYYLKDSFELSEYFQNESLKINKKVFGENSPKLEDNLYNLGCLYLRVNKNKEAFEFFRKTYIIKKSQLEANFGWLSKNEKDAFWQKDKSFFDRLLDFSSVNNKMRLTIEMSYDAILISKSLLMETNRELEKELLSTQNNTLKDQFQNMKQLRRLISKMQSEGSNKEEIISRYNSQADSLDKILVNELGEYANAKRKFEITWKDIQNSLSASEAAIEFARYYNYKDSIYEYMALVVRPEYEYPKLVKLGSELNIKNASSQKEFSELYSYVWNGIDSLLTGVKTIYYSPAGELNNVSFSALMSETNNQSDSSKSNWSYLMDRYDLQQVTTTRYLADGTLKKNESIPFSIKLIGGVNYSDLPLSKDSIEINETTEDYALQINLQNEVIDPKSNRGGKINYLKGSEIEVKEIAKTLKNSGWETTISDGKNASEYQFKQELNVKSPGIIHISTHGFAFPEKETKEENGFQMKETATYKVSEDPMVRCGLMFSGANISWNGDSKKMIETSGDDGILTAAEVANLDLSNTKLVVLSACETGLGKIESSEGTFGLKRGFKLAGVDQIIVSLWKVPDNETMELMTLFYSDLSKTNDIDKSFNKAQKEMRNRYPSEPEKWAGFVLVR